MKKMLTFDKDPRARQFSLLLLVQFFSFSNLYNTYRQYIYRLYTVYLDQGGAMIPLQLLRLYLQHHHRSPLRHWGNCNDDGLIYSQDHCG
jgi:hypothetical protein